MIQVIESVIPDQQGMVSQRDNFFFFFCPIEKKRKKKKALLKFTTMNSTVIVILLCYIKRPSILSYRFQNSAPQKMRFSCF